MEKLLKYTYLLDTERINEEVEKLWERYQSILSNPNWDDLNEARAILYILGYLYPEEIAPEAIERRLHLLKQPINIDEFLHMIDFKAHNLDEHRKDKMFVDLEKFYEIIKKIKNRYVGGVWYLDEEKFVELYNKYNPDKEQKIRERGKFGEKK
jgi:hypothetical protein